MTPKKQAEMIKRVKDGLIIYFLISFFFSILYPIVGKNYKEKREVYCSPKIRTYVFNTVLDYGTYPFRIPVCFLGIKIKD